MRVNKSSHKALIMSFVELALNRNNLDSFSEKERSRAVLELEIEAETMIALSSGVPFYHLTDILLKEAHKIKKKEVVHV